MSPNMASGTAQKPINLDSPSSAPSIRVKRERSFVTVPSENTINISSGEESDGFEVILPPLSKESAKRCLSPHPGSERSPPPENSKRLGTSPPKRLRRHSYMKTGIASQRESSSSSSDIPQRISGFSLPKVNVTVPAGSDYDNNYLQSWSNTPPRFGSTKAEGFDDVSSEEANRGDYPTYEILSDSDISSGNVEKLVSRQVRDDARLQGDFLKHSRKSSAESNHSFDEAEQYQLMQDPDFGHELASIATDSSLPIDDEAVTTFKGPLEKLKHGMLDDHAKDVQYALRMSRLSAKAAENFLDDTSPFALCESMVLRRFINPIGGDKQISLISGKKSTQKILTKPVRSNIPKVPSYTAFKMITRNLIVPSDKILRTKPYLAELDLEVKNKVEQEATLNFKDHYDENERRVTSGRSLEEQEQLRGYLDSWLKKIDLGISQSLLLQYVMTNDNQDVKMRRKHIEALASSADPEDMFLCHSFAIAYESVFQHSITPIILGRIGTMRKLIQKAKGLSLSHERNLFHRRLDQSHDTYSTATCLICGTFLCRTHGFYPGETSDQDDSDSDIDGYPSRTIENKPPLKRFVVGYGHLSRKQVSKQFNSEPKDEPIGHKDPEPCSQACYISGPKMEYKRFEVSSEDFNAIQRMVTGFKVPSRGSCSISYLLNIPCWKVNEVAITQSYQNVEEPHASSTARLSLDITKTLHKPPMHCPRRDADRAAVKPCNHRGPCNERCSCFRSQIPCEEFCGCPNDCVMRWPGCRCASKGLACRSEGSCICYRAGRECGAQCTTCGAIERLRPANRYDESFCATGCRNVPLQRGVSVKLVVGESQLAGYGAFVAEAVKKDQFIGEYVGEIITNSEAERRSLVYGRKHMSYLFILNKEYQIDSQRFGNITRFINHAQGRGSGENCTPRVVLVNGEFRVSFTALKDIKAGEELLFDYGEEYTKAQPLLKTLLRQQKRDKVTHSAGGQAMQARKKAPLAEEDSQG